MASTFSSPTGGYIHVEYASSSTDLKATQTSPTPPDYASVLELCHSSQKKHHWFSNHFGSAKLPRRNSTAGKNTTPKSFSKRLPTWKVFGGTRSGNGDSSQDSETGIPNPYQRTVTPDQKDASSKDMLITGSSVPIRISSAAATYTPTRVSRRKSFGDVFSLGSLGRLAGRKHNTRPQLPEYSETAVNEETEIHNEMVDPPIRQLAATPTKVKVEIVTTNSGSERQRTIRIIDSKFP